VKANKSWIRDLASPGAVWCRRGPIRDRHQELDWRCSTHLWHGVPVSPAPIFDWTTWD